MTNFLKNLSTLLASLKRRWIVMDDPTDRAEVWPLAIFSEPRLSDHQKYADALARQKFAACAASSRHSICLPQAHIRSPRAESGEATVVNMAQWSRSKSRIASNV